MGDIIMNDKKRRQLELAKIFYEMGMEEDLVCKVSGVEKEELKELFNIDKTIVDKYNNRANKN